MLLSVLYRLLCGLLRVLARFGIDDRDLEIAVLRHQLKVLGRGGVRPRFTTADRAFLAGASRLLTRERCELPGAPGHDHPVAPRAVGGRRRGRSRRPGRPPLDPRIKELVLRLGRKNPKWGYLRIRGELLKLGIVVSATTIATVLRRGGLGPAPSRIGPTWTQFLRLQAYGVLSRGTRSDEEDSVEDLAMGPKREAPASIGEGGEELAHDPHESVDYCLFRPYVRLLATGGASPGGSVTALPSGVGTHARDGPAMAA